MFRISASELKRQFKRMGLKADVKELNAEKIIIITLDGKEYEMVSPQAVLLVKLPGSVSMVQAIGSIEEREAGRKEETVELREEDIRLVAEQAGVSMEEARQALLETGGDIAEAIIKLEEKSRK